MKTSFMVIYTTRKLFNYAPLIMSDTNNFLYKKSKLKLVFYLS